MTTPPINRLREVSLALALLLGILAVPRAYPQAAPAPYWHEIPIKVIIPPEALQPLKENGKIPLVDDPESGRKIEHYQFIVTKPAPDSTQPPPVLKLQLEVEDKDLYKGPGAADAEKIAKKVSKKEFYKDLWETDAWTQPARTEWAVTKDDALKSEVTVDYTALLADPEVKPEDLTVTLRANHVSTDDKSTHQRRTNSSAAPDGIGNPMATAVDKPRVRVTLVPVEILDKDKKGLSKLKVGKMAENGVLTGTGASAVLDIEKDSDHFYVRLPGGASFGSGSIKVATVENPFSDYDDNETEIDLQVEGDDLISESLLLVSDNIDDDHKVDGVADDAKNDRTHKIQLGGKFQIKSLKLSGVEHQIDIRMPLPEPETVTIDITILRDDKQSVGGQPVISETVVRDFWKIAKERYAQVGVKISINSLNVEDPPAGVDLADGSLTVTDNDTTFIPLNAEVKALINALGNKSDTSNIHVFYVNGVKTGSSPQGGYAIARF